MNKCKIYVEGIADRKFIADFVSFHYNISLIKGSLIENKQNENLIETGGKDNIGKIITELQRNTFQKIKNVLIFDADNDYNKRKRELQDFKKKNKVDFDFFLFPDNKVVGDLEDLLINIINLNNQKIFDCWDSYETCLRSISSKMTLPAKKTKVYAYLEPLLGETKSQKEKIKEANRDYTNAKHWDLNNEYLKPLKDFLDKYFNVIS